VGLESLDAVKHLLDEPGCGKGIVERNVLGDLVEVPQGRFGPD
jgi:hypothetical protein